MLRCSTLACYHVGMSDGVAAERADDLIALAKASGFHVTKTQLARWHRAGLLPRPVRRQGLGRGKGTISIYPAGTGTQLLALLVIRTRERGLGFTLRARTIRARRRKLPLQPWTAASIRELSQSFRPSAFRHYVESATDDDLERARNEVRSLLGLLTGFGAVFGRRAPLLTLFQDLDSTTPLGGAMFVM